ncbi:MAG: glycogen debranching protein, partial [Acidobacteria bacterium]
MLSFDASVCTDLKESTSREWLETNGLGGFACSTISGINTRRYHSLLTIATTPPVGRIRILSKVEESLSIEDQFYNLSANIYPNAIY